MYTMYIHYTTVYTMYIHYTTMYTMYIHYTTMYIHYTTMYTMYIHYTIKCLVETSNISHAIVLNLHTDVLLFLFLFTDGKKNFHLVNLR